MNKSIGTLITALLILLLAGLAMCATPEPVSVQANDVVKDAITMEPVVIDGHGTGLVIPEALKGSNFVVPEPVSPNLMVGQLPTAFDWRDSGKVTPVKDQGGCGACYAFATLGMIEGDVLVDSGPEYDFSEEQAKECTWEAINGISNCSTGGWDDWVINLLTRVGIVLEADDPYHPCDTSCNSSTTPVERVTDWYTLSGYGSPDTTMLKSYIYTYGPIFTTLDAGCLSGYTGGIIPDSGNTHVNHAVVIVGWNDTPGYWIVKNSWGIWGESGYFRIAYGANMIGSYSSVMSGYEGYQANVRTENYDESGWQSACGYVGQNDTWGLCKFNGISDEEVTAIEFWTTGSTSDVDLYLYDSFDGSNLGTELWNVTNLSFNEPGYHSVEVDPPVASDTVVVVAHITNINSVYGGPYLYPIATDYNDVIESGKTYTSYAGSGGSWTDVGSYPGVDVALRIRVCDTEDPECEDICSGYDLWSQFWNGEECVLDELLEVNSTECGYDPCWDVTCNDTVCVGYDLYNMTCEDGECVPYILIEANSTDCGYIPPGGTPCEETGVVVLENLDGDLNATVTFDPVGELFNFTVEGNVGTCGCYYLIYYADPMAGNHPGSCIADIVADQNGDIVVVTPRNGSELNMNLPEPEDDNIDNCGARLWIVPCAAYNDSSKEVTDWSNMDSFLFETCLIWYDDTGRNLAPTILGVSTDELCYQAGDEVEITVIVEDYDGLYDLEDMQVTADLSEFCVDGTVVLGNVSHIDCITAEYTGTATVTIATTCECDNGQDAGMQGCQPSCMEFDVTATDPSQESDTGEGCMDVEPGDPKHLSISGPDKVLSLTYGCLNLDTWDGTNPEHYAALMEVSLVDMFGNPVYFADCNMDVITDIPITARLSGSSNGYCNPPWSHPWSGFIAAGNLGTAPGTVDFAVRCEGENVSWGYHTVEFLPSVYTVNVTLADDELFHDGGCSCDTEYTEVEAQLIDDTGNPIAMPGVTIEFFCGDSDYGELEFDPVESETDEDGVARTTVYSIAETNGTAKVWAEAECVYGYDNLTIIDPVCGFDFDFDPDGLVAYDGCGEPECTNITITCMNQYGNPVEVEGIEVWVDVDDDCDDWEYDLTTDEYGKVYLDYCATDCIGTVFVEAGTGCIEDSDNFEVVEPELTTIVLIPSSPQTMELCEERDFTATCYNQNGDPMMCPELDWSIDDESEAISWDDDPTGPCCSSCNSLMAEELGDGVGNVSDSISLLYATVDVTVEAGDVVEVEVEPEMIELELCSSAPITVTCYNSHGCEVGCGEYEVDIAPPEVASYNEGEVTSEAPGEATLTVTSGEGSDTVDVIVTDTIAPEVSEVVIDPSTCCIDEEISICALVDDCSDTGSLIVYADETLMSYEGDGYYCCDYIAQEGTRTVNVTATDSSGNTGNDTQTYTATNLAPDISEVILSPTSCRVGDTITVNASVSDDCTDAEDLIVKADGKNLTYTDGYFIGNFSAVEGTHNVTVIAEDGLEATGENDSAQYTATKKKVKTSSRGGGGGSSGGTYPPNWDKPKTTGSSSNATQVTVPTPTPTDVPESPTRPDASIPDDGSVGLNDSVNETSDDSPPDTPGFAGLLAVAVIGLVAVYLYHRRKP